MRRIVLILGFSLLTSSLLAQKGLGFDPKYRLMHSGNIVADKDFYVLTVLSQSPAAMALLVGDDSLAELLRVQTALIKGRVSDTCKTAEGLLTGFRWTVKDSVRVDAAIRRQYGLKPSAFDELVDRQMRPSGYYQRFVGYTNLDLLLHAWGQCVVGINYIIDQFGLGKKMRYPAIDSASFDVHGEYYEYLLKDLFGYLSEKTDSMRLFFQPSLRLALELIRANDRDLPARFEPLETGENRVAMEKAKSIKWAEYKYNAILVPGEGPELNTVPFDAMARLRCDMAVERYRKGLAPFIVVSGGYCHPFRTPYCEAIEMKKYLVGQCGLSESAVIIDPQARHTTTNFRDAGRLMIRYGLPIDRPCLCLTTKDQADYIVDPRFGRRCQRELGYLPYRNPERLSIHEIKFYTVLECLHMDPYDPLDP